MEDSVLELVGPNGERLVAKGVDLRQLREGLDQRREGNESARGGGVCGGGCEKATGSICGAGCSEK